jgi:hypothetical protein
MDMRFGTWNVRSLYRIGSLNTVARELGVQWVYRRSYGRRVALNEQRIIHFSMDREMGITS